ncbi:2-C-methyl-D-erythritol 4-phosphate cytidylyltransferase [Uliginosibacterium aquaticum]|uniref:2-C-methyl-D-erythritol 4-phosphate cytidylyltransferase n=1 Tax=Uliginosibacterium aquaticum TaxID=2731212 RepID=A0ABX2II68_9RHOO|nr:2-C-methyl-D-erythritol 4-phosphate cytidylyltransferase [Uliginosibacterium aquaticum]NSL56435.1 2-C-methyl-D-erythritol 4-phosphate cytidylyltransferase [Uliginosibacterium aquaticum]
MSRFFAIVPAAGSGSRMGAKRPKQYLELAGRPMLWHALATLTRVSRIERVCVVLSPEDEWWEEFDWQPLAERLQVLRVGGSTRAGSVANALRVLAADLAAEDWVLVHDAARACLTEAQVDGLIEALADDPVGGLLAQPVADTLKRSGADGRVAATVSREAMWQAQTPQMFRLGLLREALQAKPGVTDEAGAVEALGLCPRLIAADATNFKLTYPQDLALAELILRARSEA